MQPSASRQMPSGGTPSAQTRRLDRAPSSAMSKAVSRAAGREHLVELGEVEVDRVDVDVAASVSGDLAPSERRDVAEIGVLDARPVALDPNQLGSPDEHPSVREPVRRPTEPSGPSSTTSLEPPRSTATICLVPQFENHGRSSCQRGDSGMARPPSSTRGCMRPPSSCLPNETRRTAKSHRSALIQENVGVEPGRRPRLGRVRANEVALALWQPVDDQLVAVLEEP
jgi:hypothetical protein